MLEGHWSWATNSFVIVLLGWLPVIIGGSKFNESVLAHNLPYMTRYLMNVALVGLVVSMFLSLIAPSAASEKIFAQTLYLYVSSMVFGSDHGAISWERCRPLIPKPGFCLANTSANSG